MASYKHHFCTSFMHAMCRWVRTNVTMHKCYSCASFTYVNRCIQTNLKDDTNTEGSIKDSRKFLAAAFHMQREIVTYLLYCVLCYYHWNSGNCQIIYAKVHKWWPDESNAISSWIRIFFSTGPIYLPTCVIQHNGRPTYPHLICSCG